MIAKPRFTMMTVTVLMVLVLSAMWSAPAFADDVTPPPVEPTPEVAPPADEEVVEAPSAEPEVPPAETTEPVVVDESTPAEPVTLPEALEQLPDGTDVQVVGANGESLSLATQEAADAVATSDPIWCPVGVAPKSGIGGCTPSYTSLQDLVDDLLTPGGVTDPAKAGVIWIQGWDPVLLTGYNTNDVYNDDLIPVLIDTGDDPGVTSFTLDGSILTNMANFALTIKGGWNGVSGSTVIKQNTPSLINGASLSITNWKGIITISDIVIDSATSNTTTGANTSALLVETTKNIRLDRVTVKDSLNTGGDSMNGAKLDNRASTIASTVIVNNGIFENNEGDGLHIDSKGIVTITSLFADGNDLSGAVIDNCGFVDMPDPDPDLCTYTADKAVTLKGSLEFNNNADAGLTVYSKGLITINNVVATENGDNGVNLINNNSAAKLGVTVGGTNYFGANAIGLNVLTRGVITANNITATDNGGTGAILSNCDRTLPTGFCLALIAKTVKLTGYNFFNGNGDDGLEILSFGAITVSNLTASGNDDVGAILNNQTKNNALVQVDSVGTILLTGYGRFDDNVVGNGLWVQSHSTITLTALRANDNGGNGVEVSADRTNVGAKVYVANVRLTGLNYFSGNGDNGLLVNADGKITVSNITSSFNLNNGADLNTTDLGYGVAVTGTNNFMDNNGTGLLVDATGVITASNVTSLYNQTGASLDNQFNVLKRYSVVLTGTSAFNHNATDGLLVDSYGAITVSNLTANSNGLASGNGATLDNCNSADPEDRLSNPCAATAAYAVTLTGYANANNNFFRGLQIYSLGAVSLSNVVAGGNINVGLHIVNKFNPTFNKAIVRGVTLKGTNTFNGNDSTGLVVLSYGAITLNSINASYNGDDTSDSGSGAYLENSFDRTPATPEAGIVAKNITITGVNSFTGNYTFGLKFLSNGVATLTRISANGNDWDAENFDTGGGVSGIARSITLTCGHMFGNGAGLGEHDPAYGYQLQVGLPAAGSAVAVKGVLTLKGIYSGGNNGPDVKTLLVGSTAVVTQACALP